MQIELRKESAVQIVLYLHINGSYVKRKIVRPAELWVEAWEAQILLIQLY